jgi:hypothetical protein
MINGADSDQHHTHFVTRTEFAPVVKEVKELLVNQAVLTTRFENIEENVSKMVTNLESIESSMKTLVSNKELFHGLARIATYFVGVSGLSAVILKGGEELFKLIIKTMAA